ncbi:unnamed protein product, partial [Nesidiocoris tenuis]
MDPTQNLAFPMNVIALLPYMILHYEDANPLCILAAENIAQVRGRQANSNIVDLVTRVNWNYLSQVSNEKGKKLENLGTVMTLYSRRTFSKESFQWTKCVVKYLNDTYAHLSPNMLAFLVEVIFSQSSEVLERQSSVASSTEEVSGPDLSAGSQNPDHFGVFKDFDFLEYESESVELHVTSEGVEESSDDEVGSESPLDELVPGEFVPTSPGGGPPYTNLSLALRDRSNSTTHSDTSGSSAGDLGDLTPCNASPNMSAILQFRPITRHDSEEAWRLHIQNLVSHVPTSPLHLFHILFRTMKDVIKKSVVINKEACGFLSEAAPSEHVASQLQSLTELLVSQGDPPLAWFSPDKVANPRLAERLRFGMLVLQEHIDTFLDRKDQVTELQNRSVEVVSMKKELQKIDEDPVLSAGDSSPIPWDSDTLLHFLKESKWSLAMALARANRGLLASDAVVTAPEDDDITNILNVYCCHLVKDIP